MQKFRLYHGLFLDGKWFNHAEIGALKGGALSMLDGNDKSGASKVLGVIKNSSLRLFDNEDNEYILKDKEYLDLKVIDGWKVCYEQIKLTTKEINPIIDEYIFCPICSRPGHEKYTHIRESWQQLIDDGFIDENFLDEPKFTFEVILPAPVEIPQEGSRIGGVFDKMIMQHLSLGDSMRIQNNANAMKSEALNTYANWDSMIVSIPGIIDRELNILKRLPDEFFTQKYINTVENQDAIFQAMNDNALGIDPSTRSVMCDNCHKEIRGVIDWTNFFTPLLPKASNRKR